MQVTHLIMLHAALAVAQLSKSGEDGTLSGDSALTAKAEVEGEGLAATTPSSLPTNYGFLNTISEPDPTVMVDLNTAGETPIPNSPRDAETDLAVGSTGVNEEEPEGGGSPQYLVSNRPATSEPVQPETAPPEEATVQDLEQAASPPTETTGVFTSDSPGSPIASSTPVVASVPSDETLTETSSTVTPTPSPAEATGEAAILAVPDNSSSQPEGLGTQSPSISTPATPTPLAATETETGTIPAPPPPSTTFLSVIISSSSDPASLGFTAIATNSSSSLTLTSLSPTDSASGFVALATDSSSSSSSSSFTSSSSSIASTTTISQPAMVSTTDIDDTSLQPANTSYPHSSNEYLSSQAKVAIALVSVVGALAVAAVIGYVLWHMRMRDARLRRNQAALARGMGGGGDAGAGVAGGVTGNAGVAEKGKGNGVGGAGKVASRHKRNLSVEEKMKQALEKEHDVPLDIGKLQSQSQSEAQDGLGKTAAKATVNNRFSTFSAISESKEEGSGDSSRPGTQSSEKSESQASSSSYGNDEPLAAMASSVALGSEVSIATATASEKEMGGVGYGLGRSESLESEESHYSEGGQDQFERTETLEVQRGRYVHERSESLRSQWSDVEEYYGIGRLETDVPGPESGSAGDVVAGTGVEALGSEETLVRTESGASTSSGRSAKTIGKAI